LNIYYILLLFVILSSKINAQDVTVTLTTLVQGTAISLDSIYLKNITNGSQVMLTGLPPSVTTYEISLSKGTIIYGIKELSELNFGFSLYSNKPGELRFYAKISSPVQIKFSLYDIAGRLVSFEYLDCSSGISLITFHPGNIHLGILLVEGSGYKQVFKVTGQNDTSTEMSLFGESAVSFDSNQKAFVNYLAHSDNFTFTPGDSVRFSVYQHDIYPGSIVSGPQQGDTIVIEVVRPCPGTVVVSDYDGNIYSTIQIGTQCWMRENMNATHYADGTELINGTGVGYIDPESTIKYWFHYEDNPDNSIVYGRLYTWNAVMNGNDGTGQGKVQGICPLGWHVPSDDEWKTLEMYLGMSREEADLTRQWRGTDEGGKLKEAGTLHWYQFNIGATNKSGFSALPGGERVFGGEWFYLTTIGYWWTSTKQTQVLLPVTRILTRAHSTIYRDALASPANGMSVRCIKD